MGILAPLLLTTDRHDRLVFSTGLGTLKTACLFFFFSLVVAAMGLASRPLLTRGFPDDPFFGIWLPKLLPLFSMSIAVLGALTLGFRQSVFLDSQRKTLTTRLSVWGICLRKFCVSFNQITSLDRHNVVPKRYRPEENIKGKPIGYWEISLITDSGNKIVVDRAPKQEEVNWLCEKMQGFIAQNK